MRWSDFSLVSKLGVAEPGDQDETEDVAQY